MYIRRKVYSVAYDEVTGEEKLFSTTEIMDEDSYIERLYAEAEEEEERPRKSRVKGAAIGAGIGLGAAGAGAGAGYLAGKYGERAARHLGDKRRDKESKILNELNGKSGEEYTKLKNKADKLANEGKIEKALKYAGEKGRQATEWVGKSGKNKLIAGAAGLATVGAGAGAGALIGKKSKKKED